MPVCISEYEYECVRACNVIAKNDECEIIVKILSAVTLARTWLSKERANIDADELWWALVEAQKLETKLDWWLAVELVVGSADW